MIQTMIPIKPPFIGKVYLNWLVPVITGTEVPNYGSESWGNLPDSIILQQPHFPMRFGSVTLTSLITLGSDCPLEWKVQSKQMAVIAACLGTSSLWSLIVTGNPVLASKSLRVMKGASTTFTHRFPNLWIPFIKDKLLYIMHQLSCSSRYLSQKWSLQMQGIVLKWCFRLAFHRSSQHSIRLLF